MSRFAACLLLPLLAVLLSCNRETRTEKEESAFWQTAFIDSSYSLLYKNKDTSAALAYYDSRLAEFQETSVYPLAGRFALKANYLYFFTPNNLETARMIDSALARYRTTELQESYPRAYVGLLLFGGHIAYRLSQYTKANEYYFRAKKLADTRLTPCERSAFAYSIAMVLYRQENYLESANYFKEAYALQNTCVPQSGAVALQQQEIQSNIGLCLVRLNQPDSAMLYFDNALRLAEQYRDSLGPANMDKIYGVIYGNKAQVYLAENKLDKAEAFSLKSIALNDREGYEMENARFVKLQLADIYGRKGEFPSMLKVLDSLRGTMGSNARVRMEWNHLMASYYEQTSRPASALQYSRNYFKLKDSIESEQKRLTAADIDRQLREKEQELQIAVLKKDRQYALLYFWIAAASSCMALLIVYLLYQNYRRSKKNFSVVVALNEEILKERKAREEEAKQHHKSITEAVIRAQETERSVIGLELHDNINQVLTTVKLHNEMILEGVADPKSVLPRSINLIQECINGIRSVSKRLSAPTLGEISLEESVKDLVESINLTSKVRIICKVSGIENHHGNRDVHIGVYRILQEQLNNVLKHAGATEVSVGLKGLDDRIELSVSDNGKGFPVEKAKGGIGIMNMQTRVENLNGTFDLLSEPGKGCRLEVMFPCGEENIVNGEL